MTSKREKNEEVLRFLIEQKISSMNTAGNACMTWWVSSVVFCGSILAAVWLQRDDLVRSGGGMLFGFSVVLTVFFAGIVFFGREAIKYLNQFHKDIFALTKELKRGGLFCTEVRYFKRAMIIGTGSFTLIFIAWVILCGSLWVAFWHR